MKKSHRAYSTQPLFKRGGELNFDTQMAHTAAICKGMRFIKFMINYINSQRIIWNLCAFLALGAKYVISMHVHGNAFLPLLFQIVLILLLNLYIKRLP